MWTLFFYSVEQIDRIVEFFALVSLIQSFLSVKSFYLFKNSSYYFHQWNQSSSVDIFLNSSIAFNSPSLSLSFYVSIKIQTMSIHLSKSKIKDWFITINIDSHMVAGHTLTKTKMDNSYFIQYNNDQIMNLNEFRTITTKRNRSHFE